MNYTHMRIRHDDHWIRRLYFGPEAALAWEYVTIYAVAVTERQQIDAGTHVYSEYRIFSSRPVSK